MSNKKILPEQLREALKRLERFEQLQRMLASLREERRDLTMHPPSGEWRMTCSVDLESPQRR
jgi:hypothetical protein